MRKPVLVTRLSTERLEAVEAGFAKLVGVEKRGISARYRTLDKETTKPKTSPYGDGTAAEKIVDIVADIVSQ